jgi:hypothetical protein
MAWAYACWKGKKGTVRRHTFVAYRKAERRPSPARPSPTNRRYLVRLLIFQNDCQLDGRALLAVLICLVLSVACLPIAFHVRSCLVLRRTDIDTAGSLDAF